MPVGLRRGVSYCEASGHLIFLDVEADRYFGLDSSAETAFRNVLRGIVEGVIRPPLDALFAGGLLVDAPWTQPPHACPKPPEAVTSLLDRAAPRVSALALARALGALFTVRLELRVGGLAAALRTLESRKARVVAQESDLYTIESEAAAFRRSRLIVRSHDQCLVRSLALTRRLAACGQVVDLVIGVRARPFSAHAWVQRDDLLLNDSCDAVRGYTPILVL